MLDISSLTALVSALRAETAKDSISPETVGSILQKMLDLLNTAAADSAITSLESWQKTVQNVGTIIRNISLGSASTTAVNFNVSRANLKSGLIVTNTAGISIKAATTEKAGVMTAQQVTDLDTAITQAASCLSDIKTLNQLISQEQSTRNGQYGQLSTKLASEAATRQEQDEALKALINTETANRKDQAAAILSQLGSKTNAKPFYLRQCDTSDGTLTIKGAATFASLGYTPLIFRYTLRRGRNGHKFTDEGKRCKQPSHRGWHLFYDTTKLKLDGNTVKFRIENDGTVGSDVRNYATSPGVLFHNLLNHYDDNGKLKGVTIGYGKKSYEVMNGQRFKFAIAFAKSPRTNEPFDFNTLVTPLMEFKVYVKATSGKDSAEFGFCI